MSSPDGASGRSLVTMNPAMDKHNSYTDDDGGYLDVGCDVEMDAPPPYGEGSVNGGAEMAMLDDTDEREAVAHNDDKDRKPVMTWHRVGQAVLFVGVLGIILAVVAVVTLKDKGDDGSNGGRPGNADRNTNPWYPPPGVVASNCSDFATANESSSVIFWNRNVSGMDECLTNADCVDTECERWEAKTCSCNGVTCSVSHETTHAVCCCEPMVVMGRPFEHRGRSLVAEEIGSSAWVGARCDTNHAVVDANHESPSEHDTKDTSLHALQLLTDDNHTRLALAASWSASGAAEHASVASFARHTLQLLSLGAPADLVYRVGQAQLDEVDHARLCYAIASRFFGHDVGPGKLAVPEVLDGIGEPAFIARSVAREGCVGETIAAAEASTAMHQANAEPVLTDAFRRIARDEARHAMLAWDVLSWMIDENMTDVEAIHAYVSEALQDRLLAFASVSDETTPATQMYGELSTAARVGVLRSTTANVITPALEGLQLGKRVNVVGLLAELQPMRHE